MSDAEDFSEEENESKKLGNVNKNLLDPLLQPENDKNQQSSFGYNNDHEVSAFSEDNSINNLMENSDENDGQKPLVFDKGSKLEACFSGSLCCLVFICSSILWLILFRSLMIKNQQLYDLVYDIPTLGTYHDKYNHFFHQFDINRDQVFETENVLQGKNQNEF